MENPLIPKVPNQLVQLIITISFLVLMIVFVIIDLGVKEWADYCFWTFGLRAAKNSWSYGAGLNPETINDLEDGVCSTNVELTVDSYCPNFCLNLDNLRDGGIVMIIGCVFTMVMEIVLLILIIVKYKKPDYKISCPWLYILLPCVSFLASFILYLTIVDPDNVDQTNSSQTNYLPKNFQIEAGIVMSIITGFFFIGQAVFGMLFTRKFLSA